ncbi:M3 family metallopeptidase, partial [Oleiphilus sp. HI0066]
MSTALLQEQQLPAFETYSVSDFRPALEALMSQFNNLLEKVCAQQESSWDETVAPLSDLSRKIDHVWSIASHLKAVADSEELRAVYKTLSEELSAFYSAVAQNKELYSRYLAVSEQSGLNASQKKVLENKLRSFRLSGVALEDDAKAEFKALNQKLVGLSNRFSENVLDSSQAWSLHIVDAERLAGVPSSVISRLEERARDKGYETGYLLGLDLTLYLPVMQYCEDRDLRKVLYEAFITRASNQGPHDLSHANEELMRDIMDARLRKSELLDLASYADLSVQTKMAESPQQVLDFLYDLHEKAKPLAEKEFVELTAYAKQKFGLAELAAWDVPFVTETLRKERFDVDQELLRQYFPLPTVLSGLFEVLKRVFGVELEEQEGVSTPVPDARCFKVLQNGQALAYIYMDLYSRDGKRGGAWVGTCHKLTEFDKEEPLLPVAYLVCNFAAPSDGKPSLLTHSDVVTLFHECGHAMHHCLTKISYPEISGIAGVPWDAVELPSQFLENWCWQPEALEFLSSHVDDKESLPDALIEKMMKAKSF